MGTASLRRGITLQAIRSETSWRKTLCETKGHIPTRPAGTKVGRRGTPLPSLRDTFPLKGGREKLLTRRFGEEFEDACGRAVFGLTCNGNVPIFRFGQALFEEARRRGRMRSVMARDDEGRDVRSQHVLGLGARRGVAIQKSSRHAGDDQLVFLHILPGI